MTSTIPPTSSDSIQSMHRGLTRTKKGGPLEPLETSHGTPKNPDAKTPCIQDPQKLEKLTKKLHLDATALSPARFSRALALSAPQNAPSSSISRRLHPIKDALFFLNISTTPRNIEIHPYKE